MTDTIRIDDLVNNLPEGMVEINRPLTGKPHVDLLLVESRWWQWGRLIICVSLDQYEVHGLWLHTSVSHVSGRLPSWEDLVRVKEAVYKDRLAIQVLPPRKHYVNVAEVLHLWERLDAPTIPQDLEKRM